MSHTLAELRSELLVAAMHMREKGKTHFAEPIEHLAERLDGKDILVVEELWGIFAPTCAWDDASGAAHIANSIFFKIDELYKLNTNAD